uniref:TBC1 domain family member 7 n=1 Tax=Rhodosorus marinus TaxID=101924 RepID=A0A7S3EE67_9RHOD|mmetsp:Transcript_26762/g.103952  ORF Transcript_26762/g.103952 Transcript_26762/m.103952 type:complete len:552 (+) Transcript_26762:294-1949(+)
MNFRAAYLRSLGFEHEKIAKSEVGALFSEDVIPVNQLRKLCLRVGIGSTWRGEVWKIILGVIPPQRAAWDSTSEIRKQSYEQLYEAASLVLTSEERTREDGMLAAYSVHQYFLRRASKASSAKLYPSVRTIRSFLLSEEAARARSVLRIMLRVFNTEWESFWCAVKFIQAQRIVAVLKHSGKRLQSWGVAYRVRLLSELLVQKEPQIVKTLHATGLREEDFAKLWLRNCLADALREDDVIALWDHLIAAPADFVSHFSLELLKHLEPQINELKHEGKAEILQLLANIPPLQSLEKFTLPAAAATASLLDKNTNLDPLLTFDVEWPLLQYGDRGVMVKVMQLLLRTKGLGGMFSVDGYYGDRTENALTRLKKQTYEIEVEKQQKLSMQSGPNPKISPDDEQPMRVGGELTMRDRSEAWKGARRTRLHGSMDEMAASSLEMDNSPMTKHELDADSPTGVGGVEKSVWDGERAFGPKLWPTLLPSISAGSRGDDVKALQALLIQRYYTEFVPKENWLLTLISASSETGVDCVRSLRTDTGTPRFEKTATSGPRL